MTRPAMPRVVSDTAVTNLTPEEDAGLRLLARLLVRFYLKERALPLAEETPVPLPFDDEDPALGRRPLR